MKSIATAAMDAIRRRKAIVTGAVEITPLGVTNYTTFGVTNLDPVANGANNGTGGLTAGVLLSGFSPTDIVRVSLQGGLAWNDHNSDANEWRSFFNVIPDGVAANRFFVGDNMKYANQAAAYAGFGVQTFTGASTYRFYIEDVLVPDNTGSLSILVERGVAVGAGDPLRVWGGYGPITIGGNLFNGVGERALAQQTAGAIGGVAQGLTLTLSGIEPKVLELLDDAPQFKGAAVVIYRMIFASDGKTLLDAHVFDRGRIDGISSDETVGAAAAIMAAVESAARGLGRSGSRMRSDSDQRLIAANDGYFKSAAWAGKKTLYWAGKIPARGGSATRGSGL